MRIICAQGIGEEPLPDVWKHNTKSQAYLHETGKWFFKCLYVDLHDCS
jgi:hypothetical protein